MGLRSRKVVNKNRGQATSPLLSLAAAESRSFSGHSPRQSERNRKGRKEGIVRTIDSHLSSV